MLDTVEPKADAVAKTRPFSQEDNFRSKHVFDAVVAADGTLFYQLAETAGKAADDSERTRMTIWRLDPATGAASEITAWAANAMSPAMSADRMTVYFLASADIASRPQIYSLAVENGAVKAHTSLKNGVTIFAVAPDGGTLAFASVDPEAEARKTKGYTRITTLVYRMEGVPGYLQNVAQALHVVPVDGSSEPVAISPFDGILTTIRWSPESDRIAYLITSGKDARNGGGLTSDLYISDVEGNRRQLLGPLKIMGPEWNPDGRGILFYSPPDDCLSRPWQLCTVDCESGEVTGRTRELDRSVPPLFEFHNPAVRLSKIIPENDQSAFSAVGVGGQGRICRIALAGDQAVETIVSGDFAAMPVALSDDQLYYIRQDVLHPPALWVHDLGSGADRQLTDHNSAWQAEIAWPTLEQVVVESGGFAVESWILRPAGATAPCPAVLNIHGGPHAAFGHGFCEDFHELVGAGYAVIFANEHGCGHYGEAFSRSIVGQWGEAEFDGFMALLDEMIDRKLIDPDRLGVMGVSNGGHLTAWLMTHTDRFKAAIPEQGVYSMISMYGVSDIGEELMVLEMGGHPHEVPERYWALSPVAHAHKCRTPALLIQGLSDIRCPMEQVEQLYAILKINGCETEMLLLENCIHMSQVYGVPSQRRIRMDAVKDWFGRYIPQS